MDKTTIVGSIIIVCVMIFGVVSGYNLRQDSLTFKEYLEKQGVEIKKIHMDSIYVHVGKEEFMDLVKKTNVVYKMGAIYFVHFEGLWYAYEIPMRFP